MNVGLFLFATFVVVLLGILFARVLLAIGAVMVIALISVALGVLRLLGYEPAPIAPERFSAVEEAGRKFGDALRTAITMDDLGVRTSRTNRRGW